MRVRYMVVVILVTMSTIVFAGGGAERASGPQRSLTVSMAGEADTLDPHVTGARRAYTVMMNVFETLVYRDADNVYQPGLATEWSWNDAGTVYTFRLREGVTFHDGAPFNAQAVVYNLDRIADPALQSRFATNALGPYESSRAIDDYTVEIRYASPIAASLLLDAFSQAYLGMISPVAGERYGYDDFGRNPVGTGPFVFQQWTAQNRITLVRNDAYNWAGPAFSSQGPAWLERVTFITIPEDSTRAATLETGESDVALELGEEASELLERNPAFQVKRGDVPGSPIIFWMNVEHPMLEDIRVRRAILHAFDQNVLANTIFRGRVTPAFGPLSPVTWGYNPAVEAMYPFDLSRAAALLDDAGWRLNAATGFREKNGTQLSFDINDILERRRIEFFQAQMRTIGIDVKANAVTSDTLFAITRAADTYAMASTWWAYSDPDVLRVLYHSSNIGTGFAISRYASAQLDSMLMAALSEIDPDARRARYYEIQEFIMDRALIVPVYARQVYDGLKASITGYRIDRGQYPVLYDVRIE
ncbi:MAG: ABC transporter substrate-binding protein [Spirochaetaceae bacterium]|nr:MAG: ABC transporter substrate-binding protein [Spirochaetaceae bacterium]